MIEEFKHPWVERAQQRGIEIGEQRGEQRGELKGRVQQSQENLLALGTKRFGKPDAVTEQTLKSSQDLATLQRWFNRALQASSWDEVLTPNSDEPQPPTTDQ